MNIEAWSSIRTWSHGRRTDSCPASQPATQPRLDHKRSSFSVDIAHSNIAYIDDYSDGQGGGCGSIMRENLDELRQENRVHSA